MKNAGRSPERAHIFVRSRGANRFCSRSETCSGAILVSGPSERRQPIASSLAAECVVGTRSLSNMSWDSLRWFVAASEVRNGRPRMRVLFTLRAATGHLHPLVPLAQATRDAGHDVALAMLGSFQGTVDRLGLRWFASRSRNGTAGATAVCAPHIRHQSGAHGLTLLMPPFGTIRLLG